MARKIPNIVKEIKNNPPAPINFAYQKNVSYSQMSIFRGCPHRWKLQYKDKIKRFTSSIHTVFGTAMHEVNTVLSRCMLLKIHLLLLDREVDMEDNFQGRYIR